MVNEKIVVELSANIQALKSQLNEAQGVLKGFSDNTESNNKKVKDSFSGATEGIKNLVVGYLSLNAAIQAVGASFDTALKLDAINSALSAVLGSTEAAAAQFQRLSEFADQYGLNLVAVGEAYKNFAAAAVSANVPLEQTNYIFESVAKAASVLKLSNEDLKGSLNALSQMISKGTVSAEELRGQLGERLPGAFNLAAKAMGVTTAELGKMLENGEIMAGDLLPKLALELNKTFGDKIVGDVDSLQASVNRLSNTFTNAVNNGKIGEFFKTIVDGANNTLEIFESKSWGEFFDRFTAAITGNTQLAKSYDTIYDSLNNLNKETKKTNVDVLKSFGTPAVTKAKPTLAQRIKFKEPDMTAQAAVEYDVSSLYPVELVNSYTSELNTLRANEDKRFQATEEYFGKYQAIYIPTEEQYNAILIKQNEILTARTMLLGALTTGFETMFNTILDGGQNAFQGIVNALRNLMVKLAAAIAAAAVLFVLTGGLSAGGSKLGSIGNIAKTIGGLGFNPFDLGGKGSMVAMPTNTVGQGGYQIDIMGDKMRLLLDNQAIKNSRVV
jgi:tape measure domain-containing protein